MPRSLEAWRNMAHLPQKLHLSIHNYADSGVIHNLSLSHFSAQRTSTIHKRNVLLVSTCRPSGGRTYKNQAARSANRARSARGDLTRHWCVVEWAQPGFTGIVWRRSTLSEHSYSQSTGLWEGNCWMTILYLNALIGDLMLSWNS